MYTPRRPEAFSLTKYWWWGRGDTALTHDTGSEKSARDSLKRPARPFLVRRIKKSPNRPARGFWCCSRVGAEEESFPGNCTHCYCNFFYCCAATAVLLFLLLYIHCFAATACCFFYCFCCWCHFPLRCCFSGAVASTACFHLLLDALQAAAAVPNLCASWAVFLT